MAVDSTKKRFALLNSGGGMTRILPFPDAAMGTNDRLQYLHLYPGVVAAVGFRKQSSSKWYRIYRL